MAIRPRLTIIKGEVLGILQEPVAREVKLRVVNGMIGRLQAVGNALREQERRATRDDAALNSEIANALGSLDAEE